MSDLSSLNLDEIATVVLAPNPSPMTLEGTNTYLLGAPGCGEAVVVDPGPDLLEHREAVEEALRGLDATPVAVVVTHHHDDHAQAAGWAASWGVPLHAFTPGLVPAEAEAFRDGDVLERAGVALEALHTPGHSSDHLCLRLVQTDVVLTGDHILGRGTTVVAWPDGDMADYLASLDRLGQVGASALYPGHGPVLEDPAAVIGEYREHRLMREQEVLDALRAGDSTAAEVVSRVYAAVDPVLHPVAERSVRAHLAKLADEGRVTRLSGDDGTDEETYRA